jgi:hypothetical protein
MMAVVVSALILACAVEVNRIRWTQAFFRQQAAKYAVLEKNENDSWAFALKAALSDKRSAEDLEQSFRREERLNQFLHGYVKNDSRLSDKIRAGSLPTPEGD